MSVKTSEKTNLEILFGPQERGEYLDSIFMLNGFDDIVEEKRGAYCPISLTLTPDSLKPYLRSRQEKLQEVLERAGITVYNPLTAKFTPDANPDATPEEVYRADSMKIAANRFFVGHHLIASSGFGNECEKAQMFNRVSVVLHDRNIRVSRMEPFRTIHLAYDNFDKRADEFVGVFEFLSEYEPGMGLAGGRPVLLGFRGDEVVDLENLVYDEFPNLVYEYNREAAKVEFSVLNLRTFYENKKS